MGGGRVRRAEPGQGAFLPFDPADKTYNTADEVRYSYDPVGNVESVSLPSSDGQSVRNVTEYSYWDNGQVKQASDPWEIVTDYDYDAMGCRRRARSVRRTSLARRGR